MLCDREMSDADCGPEGVYSSCKKCRKKYAAQEARQRERILALVAQAHREGRMPPALRYIRNSATVDEALTAGLCAT